MSKRKTSEFHSHANAAHRHAAVASAEQEHHNQAAGQTPKPVKTKRGADAIRLLDQSWPYLLYVLFALFAFWLLQEKNWDYLFSVQEHSLFVHDRTFFVDRMMFIGGFAQWVGCYLTDFFFHPWVGAWMLIALWALLYFVMLRTFQLKGAVSVSALMPLFTLLASEVFLGYWFYYLKLQGYWFTESFCVLLMFAALWLYRVLGRVGRMVWLPLAIVVLYPLIGFWALVGGVWMAVLSVAKGNSTWQKALPVIVALGCTVVVPIIYYQFYDRNRLDELWLINFPLFENDKAVNRWMSLPFVIVAASPLLMIAAKKVERTAAEHLRLSMGCGAVAFVLLAFGTWKANFDNYNFHAELRMYQAIDRGNYQKVLDECAALPGSSTRQIVLSKNIALMHLGGIGERMFKFDNMGEPPLVYDSLHVHLSQTCASLFYYNYGKANFAYRWAIENGVEFGWDADGLKMMVRCAMMSGELRVAQKYLDILKKTTFHKRWADEWQTLLDNPTAYTHSREYIDIAPMRCFDNRLDSDEGLVEMYLINYFSNMNLREPKFQEQCLIYSMVLKDIAAFWPRFFTYATLHVNDPMPIHYQEAAYLYGQLEPQRVDISSMPFDKEKVVDRYNNFMQITQSMVANGMDSESIGRATRSSFGDTFWWFYYFCRGIDTY